MLCRRSVIAGLTALVGTERVLAKSAPARTIIDSHVHAFRRDARMAENRRYTPTQDAPFELLRRVLDRYQVGRAVLIQPSFLGLDNSYLLQNLAADPKRFRGVVAIPPGTDPETLAGMHALGVRGIRLNLIAAPVPDLTGSDWRQKLAAVRKLGWSVDVHIEAARISALVEPLRAEGLTVVVDHFGRPDPTLGVRDPGFQALLALTRSGGVLVKLSGAYRLGASRSGELVARQAGRALLDAAGPNALLWGSDWPHTQHPPANYAALLRAGIGWSRDPGIRDDLLAGTATRLYDF